MHYQLKQGIKYRIFRLALLMLISIGSISNTMSQPNWVATTPSTDPTPLAVDIDYGIDEAGTVYGCIVKGDYDPGWTANQVRNYSQNPVNASRISNIVQSVSGGDINQLLTVRVYDQYNSTYLVPNRTFTLFIVAVDSDSGILTSVTRIVFTTLPCPSSIYLETGFNNADRCVNDPVDGAKKTYTINTYNGYDDGGGPTYSDVLEGASWTIDWGDGSADWTFTSTYDNDGPGGVLLPGWERQTIPHSYTFHDSCYAYATLTVIQPGACAGTGPLNETQTPLLH